jgi:phage/plasmid-associated DNA primase
MTLLKNSLGEYFGSATGEFIQGKRPDSGSPQPDLLNFRKKRLVIVNEIEETKSLNSTFVRNLVGNDPINCRALFSNRNIEFTAQFKLLVHCNKRCVLEADKDYIWSKVYLQDYPTTFVDKDPGPNQRQKDPNLKEKMKTWGMDFMLILIEYYKKYEEEGVEYTDNIKAFIKRERNDNDPYAEFIEEKLVRSIGSKVKVSDVLNMFNRSAKPMERKCFKEQFSKKLGKMTARSNVYYWDDWKYSEDNE